MFRFHSLLVRLPFSAAAGGVRSAIFPRSVVSRSLQLVSPVRHSSTWRNYNRHFGRHRIEWERLKKPALFTVAFCAGTTIALPYLFQIPPFSILKSLPSAVVMLIIGLNVAGFLAWRMPQTARYMSRYGILFKDSYRNTWTLLGLAFSHQDGFHILFNMLMLYSFGVSLCSYVGTVNFLTMYLNSAVLSSFVSMAVPVIMRTSLALGSLGASGALFGIFGAFSYLFPKASVGVFFVPIPGGAWVLFLGLVALNAAGIFMKWGRYDYAAHLGGSLAGMGYGWYLNKKRQQKRRTIAYR